MAVEAGILDNKSPEEIKEYMNELGLRFEYGCVKDNDPISCHSWAQWYANFMHMRSKSASIFKENCMKRNYGDSCFKYASMKLVGVEGLDRDPLAAFHVLEHGCKHAKMGKCCQAAGRLISEGIASHSPSLKTAMPFFEIGCQLKFTESCFHLGGAAMRSAQSSNDEKDANQLRLKAFNAWIEGCNLGHELSCRNVAKMYAKGDGVSMNKAKAEEYQLKANQLFNARNKIDDIKISSDTVPH